MVRLSLSVIHTRTQYYSVHRFVSYRMILKYFVYGTEYVTRVLALPAVCPLSEVIRTAVLVNIYVPSSNCSGTMLCPFHVVPMLMFYSFWNWVKFRSCVNARVDRCVQTTNKPKHPRAPGASILTISPYACVSTTHARSWSNVAPWLCCVHMLKSEVGTAMPASSASGGGVPRKKRLLARYYVTHQGKATRQVAGQAQKNATFEAGTRIRTNSYS